MKKSGHTTLNLGAHKAALAMGVAGIGALIASICWDTSANGIILILIDELIAITGSTLIGSCAVSLLLEISTLKDENAESVKDGCLRVLDTVYGNDSSYLDALSLEKNERIRTHLLTSAINQKSPKLPFTDTDVQNSPITKYTDLITNSMLKGIECKQLDRKIQICPRTESDGVTYRVSINEYYHLNLRSEEALSSIRNHRFRFISQRQNDSFRLKSLVINGVPCTDLDKCIEKVSSLNSSSSSSVADRTFNYLVTVKLPITSFHNGEIRYRIDYEYENYETGTYLTSALSYPTQNIHEIYSLVGPEASNFIIHGFSHYPYHSEPSKKVHFKRVLSMALELSIFDNWQLPGSGSSVVVRERNSRSETLD